MIRGYRITMILEKCKWKQVVLILTISFTVFQFIGAGSKPYDSGGSTYVAVYGGYLQYTLIRYTGKYKITVETTESGENYNNGALSVKIFNIYPGGSVMDTLGSFTGEYVPINSNSPQTLMTNIDGLYTWTGANSGEGARLLYKLTGDPGNISGSKLPVL
jgi:hypothetical protein